MNLCLTRVVSVAALACSSSTPTGQTPSTTTEPGSWVVESGVRVAQASAPATLRLSDGTFRMYLPGLEIRTSTDGLAWSAPQRIALSEPGEFLRNPAVIALADGTVLMIYEGVRDEKLPTRETRFYRAVSSDGITFTKTAGPLAHGAVIVPGPSDLNFISAPDIVRTLEGALRLYFNSADGVGTEVARSTDDGRTWTREGRITISGLPTFVRTADPDVIVLGGTAGYRLFFAASVPGAQNPRIYSATSTDGVNFTFDAGERLTPSDTQLQRVDPDVIEIGGGRFRMYFGEATSGAGPYYLRSAILGG